MRSIDDVDAADARPMFGARLNSDSFGNGIFGRDDPRFPLDEAEDVEPVDGDPAWGTIAEEWGFTTDDFDPADFGPATIADEFGPVCVLVAGAACGTRADAFEAAGGCVDEVFEGWAPGDGTIWLETGAFRMAALLTVEARCDSALLGVPFEVELDEPDAAESLERLADDGSEPDVRACAWLREPESRDVDMTVRPSSELVPFQFARTRRERPILVEVIRMTDIVRRATNPGGWIDVSHHGRPQKCSLRQTVGVRILRMDPSTNVNIFGLIHRFLRVDDVIVHRESSIVNKNSRTFANS